MRSNRTDRSGAGRIPVRPLLVLLLVLLAPEPARAQEPSTDRARRVNASRGELEALADSAEREASAPGIATVLAERRRAEAHALRARLRDGDFRAGDLIVVSVRGDSVLTDTFTVSAERTLELPNLQPISLDHVLRAELQDHLAREIARFVKGADVEARPLLRVAVIGEVTRPGYYMLTPNQLISHAIMLAGGPTREADLRKTTVRRDTTVLWDEEALRVAVADGLTLRQLDMGHGDEIIVREKRRRWETLLRTAGAVSGILLSLYGASRVFR